MKLAAEENWHCPKRVGEGVSLLIEEKQDNRLGFVPYADGVDLIPCPQS